MRVREGGGPFYDVFLQLEGMCLVFFFYDVL